MTDNRSYLFGESIQRRLGSGLLNGDGREVHHEQQGACDVPAEQGSPRPHQIHKRLPGASARISAGGKQATERRSAARSRLVGPAGFFSDSSAILQQFFSVGCQDPAVATGGAV